MIEIYEADTETDSFNFQARINDDASVDGNTKIAQRIRAALDNWTDGVDPADELEYIEAVIEQKYQNQRFAITKDEDYA
jgi:hypothetical protein